MRPARAAREDLTRTLLSRSSVICCPPKTDTRNMPPRPPESRALTDTKVLVRARPQLKMPLKLSQPAGAVTIPYS